MCATANTCGVCLKNDPELTKCDQVDSKNISWLSKLTSCVPEVNWPHDCLICTDCSNELELVLSFKERCLKSDSIRNALNEHVKAEIATGDDEFPDSSSSSSDADMKNDYENETDDPTDSDTDSKRHVDSIPTSSSYKFKCGECERGFKTSATLWTHRVMKHLNKNKSDRKFKCELCDYACPRREKLERHVERRHSEASVTTVICYHCERRFKSKALLSLHMRSHYKRKADSHRCEMCEMSYVSVNFLENHMRKEHGVGDSKLVYRAKKYRCEKCEKSYTTSAMMETHSKTCDGIKRHSRGFKTEFRCSSCLKYYTTRKILNSHERVCDGGAKCKPESVENGDKTAENGAKPRRQYNRSIYVEDYACELCPERFQFSKMFLDHVVKVHEKDPLVYKPFKCTKCDNRYVRAASMVAHLKQHDNPTVHICSFCGKGFGARCDLKVHENIHLNMRSNRCELCDKGFNTHKNLRTHNIIKHRDPNTWPHHCAICDRKFPIRSTYDYHMRRHMGDKRFACHMCQKPFVTRAELRCHMVSHTNVRSFKCEHCDKEYKVKRVLEVHLAAAHGIGDKKAPTRERKHKCTYCPKAFHERNKLQRHLCTHTGERPFGCHLCEKKFTDKSYVKQHLKSAHNVYEKTDF